MGRSSSTGAALATVQSLAGRRTWPPLHQPPSRGTEEWRKRVKWARVKVLAGGGGLGTS
jgi:hypothetical protein